MKTTKEKVFKNICIEIDVATYYLDMLRTYCQMVIEEENSELVKDQKAGLFDLPVKEKFWENIVGASMSLDKNTIIKIPKFEKDIKEIEDSYKNLNIPVDFLLNKADDTEDEMVCDCLGYPNECCECEIHNECYECKVRDARAQKAQDEEYIQEDIPEWDDSLFNNVEVQNCSNFPDYCPACEYNTWCNLAKTLEPDKPSDDKPSGLTEDEMGVLKALVEFLNKFKKG